MLHILNQRCRTCVYLILTLFSCFLKNVYDGGTNKKERINNNDDDNGKKHTNLIEIYMFNIEICMACFIPKLYRVHVVHIGNPLPISLVCLHSLDRSKRNVN